MSKIPNARSFFPATDSPDLAAIDDREPSTTRLFLVLGLVGGIFWVGLGYIAYAILT